MTGRRLEERNKVDLKYRLRSDRKSKDPRFKGDLFLDEDIAPVVQE